MTETQRLRGHTCHPIPVEGAKTCPACQAGDTYNGWRAIAEALAEALDGLITVVSVRPSLYAAEQGWISTGKSALARLPAAVLAERRALEACVEIMRLPMACVKHGLPVPGCRYCAAAACNATRANDALAALAAARKTRGAA